MKKRGKKDRGFSLAIIGFPGANKTSAYVVPNETGNRSERRLAAKQQRARAGVPRVDKGE